MPAPHLFATTDQGDRIGLRLLRCMSRLLALLRPSGMFARGRLSGAKRTPFAHSELSRS
jgi:hypothetical protein